MPQYLIRYTQGNTSGPFDVYLSGSSGETLYGSGITRSELEAGYVISFSDAIPSSSVVITNTAFGCSNEEILIFPSPTPTITPTRSIPASITPTPTITPTKSPTVTPTLTVTPSRTPGPTITPTQTPTLTPSATVGTSLTPTPTPTITRTPSVIPSLTPTPAPLSLYNDCGRGSTPGNACSDAGNNRPFYSDCGPFDFGIGCTVYVNVLYSPLVGYEYVFINGALWNISNSTGMITAYASEQC
jgi:hypothetical protein